MKKTIAVALAMGFLAFPVSARPKVAKHRLTHEGEERTYYLYVPDSLPEGGAPLLLTFHGSGRNGASLVTKWTKLADRHGFIVAGLDSRDPKVWRPPEDGPGVVRSLVVSLQERFTILDRQVYLFGHSAGAVFALFLSLVESEYFAAAAVHAGSFRSTDDSVIAFADRKIPIKMIIGDRDELFSVASVERTAKAFEDHGIPVEVEVVKGHDHWYYQRAQTFNKSAWDFLSSHRLSAAPRYKEYDR